MSDRQTLESITDALVSATLRKRHELIESFIAAYLIANDVTIEDVELVEVDRGTERAWYIQRRESER